MLAEAEVDQYLAQQKPENFLEKDYIEEESEVGVMN